MIRRKLLLLALFLVKWSHQTNQTLVFKPIDDGVESFLDNVLNNHRSVRAEKARSDFSENEFSERREQVLNYVQSFLEKFDNYNVSKGIQVRRIDRVRRSGNQIDSIVDDLSNYAENHVIRIQIYDLIEDASEKAKEIASGSSNRCEYFF